MLGLCWACVIDRGKVGKQGWSKATRDMTNESRGRGGIYLNRAIQPTAVKVKIAVDRRNVPMLVLELSKAMWLARSKIY